MKMEHHPSLAAFCRTTSYQQWLAGWRPPQDSGVEQWLDSEQELRQPLPTPRGYLLGHHGARRATRLPFYLLDSLEIGSLACVDIGCGDNWFQRFYPTIWGVDPLYAVDERLTPEWWIPNWGQWPRAFSCSAMHFCDQATIAQNIGKVRGILRPGGRAMVTLNRARIRERTQGYSAAALRDILESIPGVTRGVWMDTPEDTSMDGNVWLWLEAVA